MDLCALPTIEPQLHEATGYSSGEKVMRHEAQTFGLGYLEMEFSERVGQLKETCSERGDVLYRQFTLFAWSPKERSKQEKREFGSHVPYG